MSRQHAAPVLLDQSENYVSTLKHVGPTEHGVSEGELQKLIHLNPQCLPISELDPLFANPVPICMELSTPAGQIDNFMVTASGLPVLVECKLWKNPEARREVVGQILDYAKELSRWTSSDLQREASRRLKREGNTLLEFVRAAGHDVDEIAFNDALSLNLRRGRFLLLIVGDGIREGVEAIAEYLQSHAGLHFTLGLVELPIFSLPDGGRLIVPRVLARTERIMRTVIEAPQGFEILEGALDRELDDEDEQTPEQLTAKQAGRDRRRKERLEFWTAFLEGLRLDDPEQKIPSPSRSGNIYFMLPAPAGSCWITVYRAKATKTVGIFLSFHRNSVGQAAARMLDSDVVALREELGPTAIIHISDDEVNISDKRLLSDFSPSPERDEALAWLRSRSNDFVNALRPRIRAAVAELGD
jgi:hypothetical protein